MLVQLTATAPAGDEWLGPAERSIAEGLTLDGRRRDWRLGRWAAKSAVMQLFPVAGPQEVQILAAGDGAPEAWIGAGEAPLAISVSISHRDGVAAAAVTRAPLRVGCDLELVEAREPAFVKDWFSAPEGQLVEAGDPDLLTALIWSAKESYLKLARTGLRADPREVRVSIDPPGLSRGGRFQVEGGGTVHRGTWQLVRHDLVLTSLAGG